MHNKTKQVLGSCKPVHSITDCGLWLILQTMIYAVSIVVLWLRCCDHSLVVTQMALPYCALLEYKRTCILASIWLNLSFTHQLAYVPNTLLVIIKSTFNSDLKDYPIYNQLRLAGHLWHSTQTWTKLWLHPPLQNDFQLRLELLSTAHKDLTLVSLQNSTLCLPFILDKYFTTHQDLCQRYHPENIHLTSRLIFLIPTVVLAPLIPNPHKPNLPSHIPASGYDQVGPTSQHLKILFSWICCRKQPSGNSDSAT
jgi:hypothetical protein